MYFNYFSCREFFPNCSDDEIVECIRSGLFDNLLTLVMVLDGFRDAVNVPLRITSSFRSPEHNRRVGGSTTSQHMSASAIDFCSPVLNSNSLALHLRDFLQKSALDKFVGQIIVYKSKNFIHLALSTPKHPKSYFYYYD